MNELMELTDSVRRVADSLGANAAEADAWRHAVDLGWLLAGVPEEFDGLGLGLPAVCAIQQELGRRLVSLPYVAATLALDAISQSTLEDKADWIGCLVTEEFVSAPLAPMQKGDGPLSGTFSAVPSADRASHVLVCSDDRVALLATADLQIQEQKTWDITRRLFDVTVPEATEPAVVLATGEAAQALNRRLAAQLDFALAADAVGGAAMLLDLTVDYLQTRKQFGRPLAMFQALKHRCADLKANVAAAEALLLDGLAREGDDPAYSAAMGAKAFACATYAQVAEESIQLHGGIAMTVEFPIHLYLKRAQLNEHLGWYAGCYESAIADSYLPHPSPPPQAGVSNANARSA